jgi:hypothetical protein
MKKIISGLILMVLSFTLISTNASAKVKIIIGTRSHPDSSGHGCTGDKGICIIVQTGVLLRQRSSDLGDDMGIAEISVLQPGKLNFDILLDNAKDNKGTYFFVLKDVRFNEEICKALGVNSMVVKAGKYLVDYSKLENGSVVLRTTE